MIRPQLSILIPCHSLEDFPTDLGESEAAGLLNAFAAAYHPVVLAATRELPAWRRADEPQADATGAGDLSGKIVIIPSCSTSWLPHRWTETATAAGAAVVEGISERQELVSELLAALLRVETAGDNHGVQNPDTEAESKLPDVSTVVATSRGADAPRSPLDQELVADLMAFGTAMLQADLLTRRMHYYSNLDSGPIRLEVLAAAESAVAGDTEQARRRLSRAFELLLDARERYFPVDSYLIDLCLVVPRLADKLPAALSPLETTTLLATAADWEKIACDHPDLIERLKSDWNGHRVGLVGGEYREGPTSLLPIESVLWEFDRGRAAYDRIFGRSPKVWARRRFGFSSLIPQILDRSQIPYAVHAALDDGYYPDDELSRFRWEGCDGVGVDAFSRIPLAADGATSFLRFSQRLAESMEQDQAAAIMFARWPEVSSPWLEDLRRIHRYAPVFGKIVSLETFFEDSDLAGRTHRHPATGYFAPYLTQSVARDQADPIARYGRMITRRHRLDATASMHTIAGVLRGEFDECSLAQNEDDVEAALPDAEPDVVAAADQRLAASEETAGRSFADAVLAGAPAGRGALIMNSLPFPRRCTVGLPEGFAAPPVDGPVKQVQFDDRRRCVTVDLPAAGFLWLPKAASTPGPRRDEPPTAENGVLRNEWFEVHLSEATGGIAFVKGYGRSPKRLSQQLAFRFPRKRKIASDEWGSDDSHYSAMRARSVEITCGGPALAEAVTTGDLIDQTNGDVLATFRQTIRLWRSRPVVELEIELEPLRQPEGDPWSNYYGCRFAWNDPTAVLTRSVQQTAQPAPDGRFDAPHYIEIAEDELRTTIIPVELPFHRRTGDRMFDTLLVVAGETTQRFRFVIACDEPYPMRPALEAYVPPVVVETDRGPSLAGPAGWFLKVDAKNVQITSVRPLAACDDQSAGLRIRLLETEGHAKRVRLSCFQSPTSACLTDLAGNTTASLSVDADGVTLDLHAYEIATVELRF
ncbi:MAG: hypothetical protein WBC44_08395 [Planctomycetaceae bacterium]